MNLKDFIHEYPDFPKPGISFKDISPLLADPTAFQTAVQAMAQPYGTEKIEYIAVLESRGFLFGAPLATQLNTGLVMIRKSGKLPGKTIQEQYALEYGENVFEMQADIIPKGAAILIVDDVLATGGSAAAVKNLVEKYGGKVIGFSFLIELDFLKGREKLKDTRVEAVVHY